MNIRIVHAPWFAIIEWIMTIEKGIFASWPESIASKIF